MTYTMTYAVEAWTILNDEEPYEADVHETKNIESKQEAMLWAWERMEEGFSVRMYRR